MTHYLISTSHDSVHCDPKHPAGRLGVFEGIAVILIVFTILPEMCHAQLMGRNRTKRESDLTRPAREVMSILQDAENAIENEQWNAAIVALGSLLGLEAENSDDLGYDFFLSPNKRGSGSGSMVKGSLFQRVYGLIDRLPQDAFKLLEIKYGLEAEARFKEATEASDWVTLSELATKYSFLPVGRDAALLLAERSVRLGDASSAAALYLRLFSQRKAVESLGPRVAFAAATNLASIGDRTNAIEVLELLRGSTPPTKVLWNGKELEWSSSTDTGKLLEQLTEGLPAYQDRIISQPLTFGGDSRRNANTLAGKVLTTRAWHTEVHESTFRIRALGTTVKAQLERNERDAFLIPSRVPIHVGRVVVFPTYDHRILAFDIPTGLFLWECAYTGMPISFSPDRFLASRGRNMEESAAPDYLIKRVWGESAYGQLSSDGERVFGLCERPSIDVAEQYAIGQTNRITRPGMEQPNNVLQCWSVVEQGKILWEVGGLVSPLEPKLANTYFLGAPQPSDRELFILGEQNGEVFLFALNPVSGKLLWRQPLVTNLAGPITDDALLRSVGAIPSIDGNIVLCPTISGHLVAFDRQSKTLVWAFKYDVRDSYSLAQASAFGVTQLGDYSAFDSRSADLTPVISKGVAVYAPVDSSELFAISVINGKVLWQIAQSELGTFRYVGGISGETVLCVCQNSVVGLDLRSGKMLWNISQLGNDAQVVGRGLRRDQFYYLPTSKQQILEIDLTNGQITNTTTHDEPLGNLLFATDRILSMSPFQLTAYPIKSIVSDSLKAELAKESVSIESLVKQGEMALSDNRIEDALDILEKAYNVDPTDPTSWLQLKKASSLALEMDFDKFVGRVSQFSIAMNDDINYISRLIESLEARGRYEEVLLKALEMVELLSNRQTDLLGDSELVRSQPSVSMQPEQWLATKIEKTMEQLGDLSQYPNLESAIAKQIESLEYLSPISLRRRLALLRGIPDTISMRHRFAEELIVERRYLDAESLLLERETAESLAACLVDDSVGRMLLAKIYVATSRERLAFQLIESQGDDARKELLTWKETFLQSQRFIPRGLSEFNADGIFATATKQPKWPKGKVVVETLRSEQVTYQNSLFRPSPSQANVARVIGDAMRGWDLRWGDASKDLSMFNPDLRLGWTMKVSSIGWDRTSPTVYAVDGRLILESNRTLVALNGLDETASYSELSELWHTSYTPPPQVRGGRTMRGDFLSFWGARVSERGFGVLSVNRRGVLVFENEKLELLDLNSKKVLWSRTGMAGNFFSVHGNIVYAIRPGREIKEYDLRDGRELRSTPFKQSTNEFFPLGRYAFFGDSQSGLARMVDLSEAKVLLERNFSADVTIGADAAVGLIALDNAGQYHYWNVSDQKEYSGRIDYDRTALEPIQTDRVEKRLSIARFRDKVIVLPYSSSIKIPELQIFPSLLEDSFAPVSGPVFAISATDGTLAWKKPVPVVNYSFPLLQNRDESPAIVFTRRIDLPRINNNSFASMASIAVLDLQTGELLHMSHDNECARTSTFTQTIFANESRMLIGFAATQFSLRWTDEEVVRDQPIAVGTIDPEEYRNSIKEKFDKMRTDANLNPAILPPIPRAFK